MSNGERWVYRYIMLVLLGLLVLVILDHIPDGG